MAKPKRPIDLNERAKFIVDLATGEKTEKKETKRSEIARMGGLRGGKARAGKLTKKKRSEIAKKAAKARWAK